MKKDVLTQGLHWDITQHQSGKVEFADLLFTPARPSLPVLPCTRSTSSTTSSSGGPTVSRSTLRSKRRAPVHAIEDPSTGMWIHNGLTAREKATACLDMSSSYSRKTWMSRFRIAMSVNESTLKRKLKEDSPRIPVTRNEQGRLYRKQLRQHKPSTRARNFAADWQNCVESREAKSQHESRAFRSRGSSILGDARRGSSVLSKSS